MFKNSIFLWDTLIKVKERQDFFFLFLKEEVLGCKMSHASLSKALQRVSYGGSILTLFEHTQFLCLISRPLTGDKKVIDL